MKKLSERFIFQQAIGVWLKHSYCLDTNFISLQDFTYIYVSWMGFIDITDWIAKHLFDWQFLMMKLGFTMGYGPEQKDGTDESIELGHDEIWGRSTAQSVQILF